MKTFLTLFLTAILAAGIAAAEWKVYAAPEAAGKKDGSSPENAVRLWDAALWKKVQQELQKRPVTLQLLPGKYYTQYPAKPDTRLNLLNIGHQDNLLTIRGAADHGSLFARHPQDSKDMRPASKNLQHLITLRKNCRNILIEGLYFSGDGACGYALLVQMSRDITIRDCRWINMRGVYYGASGAGGRSENIVWENCVFDNIGYDVHAHILYNTNCSKNLTLRNCRMVDAYGDFVRFRNKVDNVRVEGCTFIDNGKYASSPMLSFPLFNTPAKIKQGGEKFSTGLVVRNSRFEFRKKAGRNWMMNFHISGYNPPDLQYMMSKKDSAAFAAMDRQAQRKYLDDRMKLQTGRILFENNVITGAEDAVVYECWPNYGSHTIFPREEYKTVTSLSKALLQPEKK